MSSLTELKQICKEKRIKGYSKKTKGELVELIASFEKCKVEDVKITKPFLKWVGGKTQIVEEVLKKFPKEMNCYYEPFLGGGSVLLALLSYRQKGLITVKGKIYASDFNKQLIHLYKTIQSNPKEFIEKVNEYKSKFLEIPLEKQEELYYSYRDEFNLLHKDGILSVKSAALFLILNKLCFRGMYREGPKGFNVPFGNYKNPGILEEDHIYSISELIKDVEFQHQSFETCFTDLTSEDFVYLDPPYLPETSKSFVKYIEKGFSYEDSIKLFDLIKEKKDTKILMSNSDVEMIHSTFKDGFQIEKILCRRCINSKSPESKTNEVLVYNFL